MMLLLLLLCVVVSTFGKNAIKSHFPAFVCNPVGDFFQQAAFFC
jgi:hypothetical protein